MANKGGNASTIWSEGLSFALDCHAVMQARLARMAQGDARTFLEMGRMIIEKPVTAAVAQCAAATSPDRAFDAAFAAYRSAVRANRRRLCRH